MNKVDPETEDAIAREQLAAQRRARLRQGRVPVPDQYGSAPRRWAEPPPLTDLAKAASLMAAADNSEGNGGSSSSTEGNRAGQGRAQQR
jgi:hypothetical protein